MIVGLGNPGRLYRPTRHNFGFLVIEALAQKYKIKLDNKNCAICWGRGMIERNEIVLAKPLTYVNLSGEVVSQLVRKLRINLDRLLIVLDDVSLPFGKIRFRPRGSAGGHNGLKSIIGTLGTDRFSRLRLGISGGENEDLTNYVLAKFDSKQRKDLSRFMDYIIQAIELFIKEGLEPAMNRFNKGNVFNNK